MWLSFLRCVEFLIKTSRCAYIVSAFTVMTGVFNMSVYGYVMISKMYVKYVGLFFLILELYCMIMMSVVVMMMIGV